MNPYADKVSVPKTSGGEVDANFTHPKVDALNQQAWTLRESERDEALALSERARYLAAESGYKLGAAHSQVTVSFIEFRRNHHDLALERGFQALGVLEAVPASVWQLRLYNVLGMVHFELGERAEGLDYFQQQRSLSRLLNDREMEALAQHDIAVFHFSGNACQELLEAALKTFDALDSRTYRGIALYNLSEHHFLQNAYEVALTYAEQVLDGAPFTDFDLQVLALGVQARCYSALHAEASAFAAAQRALSLARAHAPHMLVYYYLTLGALYQTLAQPAEAAAAFERALESGSHNTSFTLEAHTLLAACYAEIGDYARAYNQQKRFQNLHDEVYRAEQEQKVRALEVIHLTRAAQHEAELERTRNAELRSHIVQLERLNAQIRELSVRDSLTGLYNRRYFSEQLTRHFGFAHEDGRPLGLILLDIDHFKTVNDTLGHAAGDAVLEGVASLLLAQIRDADIVARYGGEEFAVLLPDSSFTDVLGVAERIRQAVEKHLWSPLKVGNAITVSLGAADSTHCESTDALLRQADVQLYRAKRRGRNRVCAALNF